jgi:hypothetical protein
VAALKICRGVRTLVIWSRSRHHELQTLFSATEPQLGLLTPIHLSIFSESFLHEQYRFHYSIFRNVTHLDIVCDSEDAWKGDPLSQLSRLTHLSLDVVYEVKDVAQLFREALCACLPSLCVLVVWLDSPYFQETHPCFGDVRAVYAGEIDTRAIPACLRGRQEGEYVAISCDCDHLCQDWAAGCSTGFWTQAEAIVIGRGLRRGGVS